MIFIVWIAFVPLGQKPNLSHIFKNKDLTNLIMPSEDIKVLQVNQYQNLM